MNPRIVAVTAHDDHTLLLTFTNGEIRHFDMTAYSTVIRPLIPRTFGHPVHGNSATDSMSIRPAIPR